MNENEFLEKHIGDFKTARVLDIGCGQGRNTILLAEKGFQVDAVDNNPIIVRELKNKKNINIQISDIRNYDFIKKPYDIILANFVFDFLKLEETKEIISKIISVLNKDGIFYFSVFSTSDPFFLRLKAKLKETEKNTYYIAKTKTYRHFFTKIELEELIKPLKIIDLKQEEIQDFDDVYGSHQHNIIELIIKKTE